jgi:hypothetical protein
MERLIVSISVISIAVLLCGVILAQNANQNRSVIIVIGDDASAMDSTTATKISQSLRQNQGISNVKIVTSNNFTDDGTSNIISIGGSCVNIISAELLNVNYPSCGNSFVAATNVGQNEYIFETILLSSDRMAILIAGYEGSDTSAGANYFLRQRMSNLSSGTVFIGNSTNSASGISSSGTSGY